MRWTPCLSAAPIRNCSTRTAGNVRAVARCWATTTTKAIASSITHAVVPLPNHHHPLDLPQNRGIPPEVPARPVRAAPQPAPHEVPEAPGSTFEPLDDRNLKWAPQHHAVAQTRLQVPSICERHPKARTLTVL